MWTSYLVCFFYFYGILLVVAKQDRTSKKKKILQAKKAFNMSIILASLNSLNNKSTEERDKRVEQALLQVEVHLDDDNSEGGMLTPHLLKQLLKYAPNKDEVCLAFYLIKVFAMIVNIELS